MGCLIWFGLLCWFDFSCIGYGQFLFGLLLFEVLVCWTCVRYLVWVGCCLTGFACWFLVVLLDWFVGLVLFALDRLWLVCIGYWICGCLVLVCCLRYGFWVVVLRLCVLVGSLRLSWLVILFVEVFV